MTLFIADASSNNGHVNWTAARGGGLSGGIEKVTQGHSYVNPLWPDAKQQLELLARAHQDWLSGCYLFMDGESSGSTQAQFFIEHAGNLDHFFIMVDVERVAGLSPTIEQAMECVRMLKRHYGSKPIAGYAPHWYTGKAWLGFFDVSVELEDSGDFSACLLVDALPLRRGFSIRGRWARAEGLLFTAICLPREHAGE